MEITEQEEKILLELFRQCHEVKQWVHAERFMVNHEDEIDIINKLVEDGLIKRVNGYSELRITFAVFYLLNDPLLDEVLNVMSDTFYKFKEHFKQNLGASYLISDLADDVGVERDLIIESVLYLKDILSVGGTIDKSEPDACYTTTIRMLDYKEFSDVIAVQNGYLKRKNSYQTESKTLLPGQINKKISQAVALTLWAEHPNMTIAAMTKHPSIIKYGCGDQYVEKTLRSWFSEIDPRDPKKKVGRPPKNIK